MMYLRISNPGIADPLGFTLLGASTTRGKGSKFIGQFGSGSKHAVNLLLRNNIQPVVYSDQLKMTFGFKPVVVGGRDFQRVFVKYAGKDQNGSSRSSTEDLGYTLEWGALDWTDISMALREFVSNALDGCLMETGNFSSVKVDLVEESLARVNRGTTQVFIPAVEPVLKFYRELNLRFLHFARRDLLEKTILPKLTPEKGVTRIYKRGVCVATLKTPSVYDYNLEDLHLDESRNAGDWDVRHGVAKALQLAEAPILAHLFHQLQVQKNMYLLEEALPMDTELHSFTTEEKAEIKKAWHTALETVGGKNAIPTTGREILDNHLISKGYVPCQFHSYWVEAMRQIGLKTESDVLSESEMNGEVLSEPTKDMLAVTDKIWKILEKHCLLNNREKPEVMAFTSTMIAASQRLGYYREGIIYLHTDIGTASPMLFQTILEELAHHVTGATDMSRDFQDYLLRLTTAVLYQ